MKDAVCLECDCKIDVTVISCRATACNAFFSVITVAVVLAFGNAYLINIAWNLIFRASFSYFLSNPIEYLWRLSISNPANQLKDLGKKTENIKIPGN